MKFCVNCIHSIPPKSPNLDVGEYTKCGYTFPNTEHPVTGKPVTQAFIYCVANRKSYGAEECGPDARFFEERLFKVCPNLLDNGQPCGDEGRMCEECLDKQAKSYDWMRGLSQGAATGVMSEQEEQAVIAAGRGHLV